MSHMVEDSASQHLHCTWRELVGHVFCCFWNFNFTPAGGELSAAIASWQQRHQLAAVLSTGFLDGSHPIVDAYELGVRLQHMLRRLTALAAGALVQVGTGWRDCIHICYHLQCSVFWG
jgi:hypothetical protein